MQHYKSAANRPQYPFPLIENIMASRFKYPFPGIENITENYSQTFQDMFVLAVLSGKKGGVFLEVGAYDPTLFSNTLLLERDFGWRGISIDYNQEAIDKMVVFKRKTKTILADALTINYNELLKTLPEQIDYLSLDLDPNVSTFACLNLLLKSGHRFSIVTFETDVYSGYENGNNQLVRPESRILMKKNGYELVNGNVSAFDDDTHPFEDWYLDGAVFNSDTILKFRRDSDDPQAPHKYLYTIGE